MGLKIGGLIMKQRKIDRLIELKVGAFDLVQKLEKLQNLMNQLVSMKEDKLRELQDLEAKLVNRYTRAKKLVG
jgi:hypothetical protein